ncbi:MAG: hypothetical protein M1831_000379 [Alyxoria varia]|nr:MAG: hypothetical protein M1831_000379 [Alyxoria varia]
MVLENKPPRYHRLLDRTSQSVPTEPPEQGPSPQQPPSKKLKRSEPEESDAEADQQRCISPDSRAHRREIADSEEESGNEPVEYDAPRASQTDLEQALPPIRTDREAIAEYESMRHAEIVSSSPADGPPSSGAWAKGKSSIYTDSFMMALDTVLDEESHLFDSAEMKIFEDFRSLSYEAQYLYVRLFLRKTSAWFRIESLGYHSDIADLDSAIADLFQERDLSDCDISSEEDSIQPEEYQLSKSYTLADSSEDHINSLEEASSLLRLDELKEIAKEAKVQGKNKADLLRALRRTSGKQTGLGHFGLQRSDTQDSEKSVTPEHRSESPEKKDMSSYSNRDDHFVCKILTQTGKCIRLSIAPFKLFERVHLVFFRSTEWTEKSLITIILARISRRNFPEYIVSRSSNIFPSRSLLLEFEASLRTQFRIDSILEFNGQPPQENLQWIRDEALDKVYPRWKVLLRSEQHKEDSIYSSGEGAYLRRLSPAWVYTRIVHKGAWILGLGKFKEHAREHAILTELLDQRLFHHARRGAWYQRKALLEEHYMAALSPSEGRSPEEQKKHWKRIALRTCERGLQDNLVHIIYHYDLQKRLLKLEKALRIAKRFQHDFGHARLAKPAERTFEGTRIEKPSPRPSGIGNAALQRHNSSGPGSGGGKTMWIDPDPSLPEETHCTVESMCLSRYRSLGYKGYHSEGGILRTLFALLFYDVLFAYVPNVFQTPFQTCPLDLHTDGFYPARASEINARVAEIGNGEATRIIEGVWDREYERRTCVVGLDWGFDKRDLLEIAGCVGGGRLAALCKVMAQEYAQRGGGVPDLFLWKKGRRRRRRREGDGHHGDDRDDVVDDDGNDAYDGGDGEDENECLFAEVKSENDRLSDTQRQWIHVLTGAGFRVELCHAVASEVQTMD